MTVALPARKPNILFLMSDSLAPHFTGAYGDSAALTPTLDRLAQRGVLFENAYCNSPLCAPSRASLITGRYVSDLICFDNANELSAEWPTFGHSLAAQGYETSIIGKMHLVGDDQRHGFQQRLALQTDYSTRHNPHSFGMAYDWLQPSAGNPWGGDWMGASYVRAPEWDNYRHHYDRDEVIHREALSYLAQRSPAGAPFFCCVSYHAPHNPFWIPEHIRKIFRDRSLPLPRIPEGAQACQGPMDRWVSDFHYLPRFSDRIMTEENLRWLYEIFYAMIHDLDQRIAELLATLERSGLADSTVLVFASDHGDMMGHHGMIQKRCFYERSARVALLFSWPGHWRQSVRLANPVSLLDLFPTLSDLASAPVPAGLPGQSLLPCLVDGAEPPRRVVFSEYHGEGVHAPCFMAREGDFKYIYVHGHEERLYNVADDPDEYRNLISDTGQRQTAAQLREAILQTFDPEAVAHAALRSQANRRFIYRCHLAAREHGKG